MNLQMKIIWKTSTPGKVYNKQIIFDPELMIMDDLATMVTQLQ